ncbi:triphosphoribosyl-dephospho-CoA synthase [Paenibacillus hemerocallicola]|uniref:triphosphoribosyl-dephospho-CoA synthase n=1 Tax=Paenibacillus hemerocallicola TaxID=1172614 RepID=A0A5C4TB25_9BACL|nr:triphosphoribosyl-dephospho-CoA synthase [Paenibacillus hemerocallicola]TNJ66115.1 triphosphoribosyl-dephospho-CoA synthase [Paenibacillus hemerocallicola]
MVGGIIQTARKVQKLVRLMLKLMNARACVEQLSAYATSALIDEAELTPKPGLVDLQSNGAHDDLNVDLMRRSAFALQPTFAEMAEAAYGSKPSIQLRERLAAIGRNGERIMLEATGGVNTHRGAIWALGLLTAAAAMAITECGDPDFLIGFSPPPLLAGFQTGGAEIPTDYPMFRHVERVRCPAGIARIAGVIACFPDRFAPASNTHGRQMQRQFGAAGARREAQQGFPHVLRLGLPALLDARSSGMSETCARLDSLMHMMSHLEDTCLLYRGGMDALHTARQGARNVLSLGGTSVKEGWQALEQLDRDLVAQHASPGGSADLLAAVLFLDRINRWKSAEHETVR